MTNGIGSRFDKGTKHWNAKVNEDDVRNIRALFAERRRLLALANKLTIAKIAAKFDLTLGGCRDIIFRATWKHVQDSETYKVS